VSRTDNIAGVTTQYLWDENSITGYAQVVEEIESGTVIRRYAYGAAGIISQSVYNGAEWNTRYCGKDGTGSIRSLTDESGQVVFERDYDAWGNVLSTLNLEPETLSCYFGLHGEYVDPAVNLVYLRARWYAPDIGRFVAMDSFEGMPEQPISLNKYLSFNANPVNNTDPLGYWSIGSMVMTVSVIGVLSSNVYATVPSDLGEAWPHKADKWTDADIVNYRSWIKGNYLSYIGRELECSKLATSMLIDYAAANGLPVRLNSWYKEPGNPTPHYSNETRYRNKEIFLRMANAYISAEGIWKLNTYEKQMITKETTKLNNALSGDLLMHIQGGAGYTGHTMILINYSSNIIGWIQGTQPPEVTYNEKGFSEFMLEKKPQSLRFWDNSILNK